MSTEPTSAPASPELKQLWIRILKRVHPDLAINEQDKARCEQLTKEANAAYSARDIEALKAVLEPKAPPPPPPPQAPPNAWGPRTYAGAQQTQQAPPRAQQQQTSAQAPSTQAPSTKPLSFKAFVWLVIIGLYLLGALCVGVQSVAGDTGAFAVFLLAMLSGLLVVVHKAKKQPRLQSWLKVGMVICGGVLLIAWGETQNKGIQGTAQASAVVQTGQQATQEVTEKACAETGGTMKDVRDFQKDGSFGQTHRECFINGGPQSRALPDDAAPKPVAPKPAPKHSPPVVTPAKPARPVANVPVTVPTETHFVGYLTSTTDLSSPTGGKPGRFRCTYTYSGYHGTTATFVRDLDEPCPAALSAPSINDWVSSRGRAAPAPMAAQGPMPESPPSVLIGSWVGAYVGHIVDASYISLTISKQTGTDNPRTDSVVGYFNGMGGGTMTGFVGADGSISLWVSLPNGSASISGKRMPNGGFSGQYAMVNSDARGTFTLAPYQQGAP
jgi:hypothetical protein